MYCVLFVYIQVKPDRDESDTRSPWVDTVRPTVVVRVVTPETRDGTRPGQTRNKPKDLSECDREERCGGSVGGLIVYYESMKRKLKIKPI
jgi:hypothetical protein